MTFRAINNIFPSNQTDLLALVRGMEKRAKNRPRQPEQVLRTVELQLPLWGEEIRCMPNEILRSALFNARNRKQPRAYFKNEEIGIIGQSTRITYTGEELRQYDESVWLQLIHLARIAPIGSPIEFTAYSMVQALRLAKSKPNPGHIERLRESLQRMQATALTILSKRLGRAVSLSMIPKFEWQDEISGARLPKWRVFIAPELVDLFGNVHFTRLQWSQRLDLPSGLATWMHGYLASHRDPMPLKLTTLQLGSGCTTVTPRKFKQLVANALAELERVKFLADSKIDGKLVHFCRSKCSAR
ncbi:plasmid replication initiator TrfA [Undibacterium terreum]|uniref:plasmid replication initiator TrfA n=1 Tax=Undibacterium terreum TaxID=1224302 RepID=UPI00280A612C|nr:plasmid replication initiator TrfA [Undibacterium terreum]